MPCIVSFRMKTATTPDGSTPPALTNASRLALDASPHRRDRANHPRNGAAHGQARSQTARSRPPHRQILERQQPADATQRLSGSAPRADPGNGAAAAAVSCIASQTGVGSISPGAVVDHCAGASARAGSAVVGRPLAARAEIGYAVDVSGE